MNATNVRFSQLVDGMDIQAPHIGAPIANNLGPIDLDISRVELISGTASALYGMNTLNGLVNFFTLDPFNNPGFSFQQQTGINHIADDQTGAKLFTQTSFKYAKAYKDRFAFKINIQYSHGYDWIAHDYSDLNPKANTSVGLTGADNPGADAVNSYGNESSDVKTLTLGGKKYVVARTGYTEAQSTDYSLQNVKGDIGLYYKPSKNTELSYTYKAGELDNVYQRTNRFRLSGYLLQQHSLSFKSNSVTAHAYFTQENTGQSYNIRSMAENIDKTFKGNTQWYNDFTTQFNNSVGAGATVAQAMQMARTFADNGRPQPGSAQFNKLVDSLGNINNWDYGAALRVKTYMFDAEAQWDLTKTLLPVLDSKYGINILTGFDFRSYIVVPDGNYFINPTHPGDNIVYSKGGIFAQASKTLFNQNLKIIGTLRMDENQYFTPKLNPRLALVYSPSKNHSIRISYQSGFRFPSLFEAFSNVNSGGVKRVGGLPIMSHGIFEDSYYKTSVAAFQAAVNKDVNTLGITTDSAVIREQGLLAKNTYTYIQPEHINSFEIGYRGAFFNQKLFVDVDAYYNIYHAFIAQVEVNVPRTQTQDSVAPDLYNSATQDKYRMWTNSKATVYNYGGSVGLRYNFYKKFELRGNLSFAKLSSFSNDDGLEEGFNTPEWMTNISFGNRDVYKGLGFNVNFKWQSAYLWQSALATGNVPSFYTFDAQITYAFPGQHFDFKLGGTNILNRYYTNFTAGPSIGGFYYVTVTYKLPGL